MKSDPDRLQGAWWIVSLEVEGQKFPPAGSKIAIHGDRFVSLNMGAEYEGSVTFDETRSPKTFDLVFTNGPEAGNESLGIYELDGDTWRICLGLAGKPRPRELVSRPGAGHALQTLKRDKGAEDAPPATVDSAAAAELEGNWSMVSCIQDGQHMDQKFIKSAVRSFRCGATTLTTGGRPFMKGRFTANAGSDPRTIDYPDSHQIGIYKLSGDTLHTSLAPVPGPRPADFTATPGDTRTVSVWRRKKS